MGYSGISLNILSLSPSLETPIYTVQEARTNAKVALSNIQSDDSIGQNTAEVRNTQYLLNFTRSLSLLHSLNRLFCWPWWSRSLTTQAKQCGGADCTFNMNYEVQVGSEKSECTEYGRVWTSMDKYGRVWKSRDEKGREGQVGSLECSGNAPGSVHASVTTV